MAIFELGGAAPIAVRRGSNVQALCMLHADPGQPLTIGNGVTVGHQVTCMAAPSATTR